ncbi:methyl-accepting chemotaxis protein [Phaeovulum sp. W22_SRMD_FR3]|uniref:methyl-accepting chemotaxis protein n=1 Tax=Phaeovulum sp. W22_SRMD_FR3 TaxID=3240274 RepID=UPI003F9DF325
MFRAFARHAARSVDSNSSLIAALNRAQGLIWFDLDGKILDANENFLSVVGYRLEEIQGQMHRIFVTPEFANSAEYKQFWNKLSRGEVISDTFSRIGKNGKKVWIEASYNPVFDAEGKPVMVVKFAVDVTAAKEKAADAAGQLMAISTAQAVIEFDLHGKILAVNDNFCATMGYSPTELIGQHHSLFMPKDVIGTAAYRAFWEELGQGKYQAGEFRRLSKTGAIRWLQANYSPILDTAGKVYKVVKYAVDITADKNRAAENAGQMAAISKVQAVIEFDLEGKILTANENFCTTMGYSLDEIRGQRHAIFVDQKVALSDEYRTFWENLRKGEFQSGEFRRLGKDGREVWIRGSYNPILDSEGRPFKVVKYATDSTPRKTAIDVMQLALSELADGNLTAQITTALASEFDSLRQNFNMASDKLNAVMMGVVDHAATIQNETSEISQASDNLSRRTEQQAATLEETAAAIDQLTASVRSASELSALASKMVADAKQSAEKSGVVVRDAVKAMDEIADSSTKISKITSVIDEIAFQTNLLALNAGVEAARAGEAGRGFAVVASEVRALAQRSSDAAREIAALISASSSQVSRGVGLVGQAGRALQEIDAAVSEIHLRVTEIATSSQEQASGLAEINLAVNQLDQVTQQNAAMFEETNAATGNLTREAVELAQSTAVFTTGLSGSGAVGYPGVANRAPRARLRAAG